MLYIIILSVCLFIAIKKIDNLDKKLKYRDIELKTIVDRIDVLEYKCCDIKIPLYDLKLDRKD